MSFPLVCQLPPPRQQLMFEMKVRFTLQNVKRAIILNFFDHKNDIRACNCSVSFTSNNNLPFCSYKRLQIHFKTMQSGYVVV